MNNVLLNRQCEAKRLKLEIAKEKILQKATENYIEAVYYNRMYRSDACWKTVREVSNGVKKLKTKKDKYEALKENIKIRVIGFGWDQFHQTWSKDGNPHSIEFLAEKLKDIIRKSKKLKIPEEPPIDVQNRKNLPSLGERTADVKALDLNYIKDTKKFKKDAQRLRREREDSGYGDMYSVLQSVAVPKIDDSFIGKRIDVLFAFEILDSDANEQELRWCQGEVTKIITGTKKPTVEVRWDTIPELNHAGIQILPERKWNKYIEGAWRMNIDIIDKDCDDESNQ